MAFPTMSTAGSGNSIPPSRSKLPERMFSRFSAHWHSDPKPCVDSPMRPYAAAPSAAANSRVILRISSAGTPDASAAYSGVMSATASRTDSMPRTYAGGSAKPSSSRTCTIARSTTASVAGRTKWCSSATFAVSVRRGSKTTIFPPRFFSSRRRLGKSGTVISDPLEAIGLAPKTRK
jgi:hypothetical protein